MKKKKVFVVDLLEPHIKRLNAGVWSTEKWCYKSEDDAPSQRTLMLLPLNILKA